MTRTHSGVQPAGWRRLLALRPKLVDFDQRRFHTGSPETRRVLEVVGGSFLTGFNLEIAGPAGQPPELTSLPAHRRGFAAEGAAMAAALLDLLNPAGGRRLAALHRAHAERHIYLIQVGVGWAMAALRRRRLGRLGADQPLLRWLAYDGMGFFQGFFASPELRRWARHPAGNCPATCDIRHQGFGRSLWFRECGDPERLADRIAGLSPRHHGDAWSGVGLAACFAGGVEPEIYRRLRELAGPHQPALAQGAAFAAEAWRRSGHTPPHAHTGVMTIAGVDVAEAAQWTATTRPGLDHAGASAGDFRHWRQRIQRAAAEVTDR